jgi:hypothetical protein
MTNQRSLKSHITNAEWSLSEQPENDCLLLFTDEKVNYEWYYDLGDPNEESKLNGRLMAKSPQMLKLLFEARAALQGVDEELVDEITEVIDYIDTEALPIIPLK